MEEIDKDDLLMFPCEIGKDGITKENGKITSIGDLAKIQASANIGRTFSIPMPGDKLKTMTALTDKANRDATFVVEAFVDVTQRTPLTFSITALTIYLPHVHDMKLTVIGGFNRSPLTFNAKIDNFTVVSEPWMSKLVGEAYAAVNANLWAASSKSLEDSWETVTDEILSDIPVSVRPIVRSYASQMGLSLYEEFNKLREFADHFGPVLKGIIEK